MATGPDTNSKIGVDALLELTGTDREAKAYAFLYAAFRRTEISANPVRDALDCLVPFITPYINNIPGKQVTADGVKSYLKSTFGFDIPIYAVEQFINNLQKQGYVDYNRLTRAHIAKKNESGFAVAKAEIETEFDEVASELSAHAKALDFPGIPPSGSWEEALIAFLKTATDRPGPIVAKIKGGLVDPQRVETAIVGGFIKRLYERNAPAFEKIVRIFMGVLVEEFISSVSEIGSVDKKFPVTVFYDTAVLLRLLGTSGKILRSATEELNRYLQDLGFTTLYLSGNESEVAGIFDTIIFIKDSGKELEGETAAAISAGEVSITDIRMLQNSFPEQLAKLNVFPGENLERSAQENAAFQIDEKGFSHFLLSEANAKGRAYGVQNRENDATYLGTVMRLRKRLRTKDLTGCGYVFVTSNKFLAQTSRRYLLAQRDIQPQHCPPILSVGQIATIAWLMKDHKLVPEKAGRELLCNCFAAIRPDAEWFKYFREGVEKAAGSLDEFGKSAASTLTLQAARRIAQEESFGNTVLVRELNMAEILSRAADEGEKIVRKHEVELAETQERAALEYAALSDEAKKLRLEDGERLAKERDEAVRVAAREAAEAKEIEIREALRARAVRRASGVMKVLRAALVVGFIGVTTWAGYLQLKDTASMALWSLSTALGLVSVLAFMDLVRVRVVSRWFDIVEAKLVKMLG